MQLVLLLSLALSACGGGGSSADSSGTPAPAVTPPTSTPPPAADSPQTQSPPPVQAAFDAGLWRNRLAWATAASMADLPTLPFEAAVLVAVLQEEGAQPQATALAQAFRTTRSAVARFQATSDNDGLAQGVQVFERLRENLPAAMGDTRTARVIERAQRQLWGRLNYLSDVAPVEQWRLQTIPASREAYEELHRRATGNPALAAWIDTALMAGANGQIPSVAASHELTCSTGIECEPIQRALSISSEAQGDQQLDSLAANAKAKVEESTQKPVVESAYAKDAARVQNAAENLARWLNKSGAINDARATEIRSFGTGLSAILQQAGLIRTAARELSSLPAGSLRWGVWKAALFAAEPGGKGAPVERLFELASSVWTAGNAIVTGIRTIQTLLGGSAKAQRQAQELAAIQQITQRTVQQEQGYAADERFAELVSVVSAGQNAILSAVLTQQVKLDAINTAVARANELVQVNGREVLAALRALSLQQLNSTIRDGEVGPDAWLSSATTSANWVLSTSIDDNVAGGAQISADPSLAFSHDMAALNNALAQWPAVGLGLQPFATQRLPAAEASLVTTRYFIPMLENPKFEAFVRANKTQVIEWARRIRETRLAPLRQMNERAAASVELPVTIGARLKDELTRLDNAVASTGLAFLRTAGPGGSDISSLDVHAGPLQPVAPRLDPALQRDGIPPCPGQAGSVLPASTDYVRALVPAGAVPVAAVALARPLRVCFAVTGQGPGGYSSVWFTLSNDKGGRHMLWGNLDYSVRTFLGEQLVAERTYREAVCYYGATDSKSQINNWANAFPAWTVLASAWTGTWRGNSWCYDAPTPSLRDRWLSASTLTVDWTSDANLSRRQQLETDVAQALTDAAKSKNRFVVASTVGGSTIGMALDRLAGLRKAADAYVRMSPALYRNPGVSLAFNGDDGVRIDDVASIMATLQAAAESGSRPELFAQRSAGVIDGLVLIWTANAERRKAEAQADIDSELAAIESRLKSLEDWARSL